MGDPVARAILAKLAELYPDARCALEYRNPFELLVATMLSAQCTDKLVNRITPRLFAACPAPEDFCRLTAAELEGYIRECGLHKSKARHILAACRKIVDEFGGEVPRDRERLEQLPGVGRKTANVVLANAFGVPALAVDRHVFRVANRLGLAGAATPEETERQLMAKIPEDGWVAAHHRLIRHGRLVCSAREPRCDECGLRQHCRFMAQSGSGAVPSHTRRAKPSER